MMLHDPMTAAAREGWQTMLVKYFSAFQQVTRCRMVLVEVGLIAIVIIITDIRSVLEDLLQIWDLAPALVSQRNIVL